MESASRNRSRAAFERAKQLIPGGVNSPARAFGGVGGDPIVFELARGAYIYDVDGNRYIDYVGSWGPMILGHQHPAVVEAVHAAASKAFSFGAPTAAENELAELITQAVPEEDMERAVEEVLLGLRASAPRALSRTKELLNELGAGDLAAPDRRPEAFRRMGELSSEFFAGEDAAEGRAAFFEKRPPRWAL